VRLSSSTTYCHFQH